MSILRSVCQSLRFGDYWRWCGVTGVIGGRITYMYMMHTIEAKRQMQCLATRAANPTDAASSAEMSDVNSRCLIKRRANQSLHMVSQL